MDLSSYNFLSTTPITVVEATAPDCAHADGDVLAGLQHFDAAQAADAEPLSHFDDTLTKECCI